jgi:hypothetical protein
MRRNQPFTRARAAGKFDPKRTISRSIAIVPDQHCNDGRGGYKRVRASPHRLARCAPSTGSLKATEGVPGIRDIRLRVSPIGVSYPVLPPVLK